MRRAFRLPTTSERIAQELDDEVRFHVEMRAKKLIESGYSTEDAYAEALRRFGDVDDLRDYCMAIEVPHMQRMQFRERVSTVMQDFRFALRQFRKAPGFAFIAALTLALGIGATTAIFSVVNGVILRPLPFDDSERMVYLFGIDAKGKKMMNMADPTFDAVAAQNRSFEALAEYQAGGALPVISDGEAIRVPYATVSRGYFDVLHVKPARGRFFAPGEQQLGAAPVAVISSGFWERQFAKSPNVIGQRITTSAGPITIVGVLPPGKEYPAETDLLVPREIRPKNTSYTAHNWKVIGRIKPGVTLELANQDLSSILRGLRARVGDATWTVDGVATTLRERLIGDIKPLLVLIFASSALLLIIACANVANLLIARMASRENEIAVRVAIGAGRGRLVQQLLIESGLLALIGCVAGLLLAYGGVRTLLALRPASVPRVSELTVDWHVMMFALGVSAATAITLGLIAAWRGTRGDLRAALAQSQRTQSGGGSHRVRGTLVVLQIAMTVVLLIGAALLGRSFVKLLDVDAGFRTKGVVVMGAAYNSGDAPGDAERRQQYEDDVLSRARSIPGVTAVGLASAPPFSGGSSNGTFGILPGTDVKLDRQSLELLFRDKSQTGYANYQQATEGYFKALNIPLVSGRLFDERDRRGAPEVAVISQSLAKSQWPNENPIGKAIEFGNIDGDLTPMTIVGVVGDTREQDLQAPPANTIYVSARQRPSYGEIIVIMATSNEAVTSAEARRLFHQFRPDVALRFQTVGAIVARSIATQRFLLLLVGVFGIVALLLATLGVYSVISYLVTQREREIGVRVALGARGSDIVRLVIGQGLTLAVIGALAGGVAAVPATRLLKGVLYEVSTTDPLTFVAVLTMLCAVAAVASYLPARRAARTEPMDILRGG